MIEILDYIISIDKFTLALGAFVPAWIIGLIIAHAMLKKKNRSLKIWRILCLVPIIPCVIHFAVCSFKSNFSMTAEFYFPIYAGALCATLWQFLLNRKIAYRIASAVAATVAVFGTLMSVYTIAGLNFLSIIGNYSRDNYVDSFLGIMADMKEHYCLNEWKEIDYDAIEKRILPKVEQAQQNNDKAAYYMALREYTYLFNDGHVSISPLTEKRCKDIRRSIRTFFRK